MLPNDEDVLQVWRAWRATGSHEQRNRLIVHYSPIVHHVVKKMPVSQQVDTDDLVSLGTFGLIDAIDRFDPDLGFRFSTYAVPRIRGRILDELRVVDWAPRTVRANTQAVATTVDLLSHELGRTPTDGEVALSIGDGGRNALREASHAHMKSLDEHVKDSGDYGGPVPTLGETLVDDTQDTEGEFEVKEIRSTLVERMRERLDARAQMVLALYYNEGLTLEQVGIVFGVTESRICQVHMQAMELLRG